MNNMRRGVPFLPRDAASRIRAIYKMGEVPTEDIERKSGFSTEELEEAKEVFRYFDRDNNKHLDKKECQCWFKHEIGRELDKFAFDKVFGKMDANSDGVVSFPEYLNHLSARKRKFPNNYHLEDLFNVFDRNEDGLMNLDDLRHALLYLGEDAGRTDLKSIFVHHDGDKDGLITRFEFQDLVKESFPR